MALKQMVFKQYAQTRFNSANPSSANPFSLRTVLMVILVGQSLIIVGILGYFSLRNGRSTVSDLASQLQIEIGERVEAHVNSYLQTPHRINALNARAAQLDQINLQDFGAMEQYFWQQSQVFDQVSYIYFGNQQGELIGVEQRSDGSFGIGVADASTDRSFHKYLTDDQGNRGELLWQQPNFDGSEKPWYQAALKAGEATWSPVYVWSGVEKRLSIDAVLPIYATQTDATQTDATQQLSGVLAVSLTLEDISDFLGQLKVGKSGIVFIVDHQGDLIASSTPEQPFWTDGNGNGDGNDKQESRLAAIDSTNPVIQETAAYLQPYFSQSGQPDSSQSGQTGPGTNPSPLLANQEINGESQFLHIAPLSDNRGIDWLVVVVVPEADFMTQVWANTRTTVRLFVLFGGLAIILSFGLAHWVSVPIWELTQASRTLAAGEWKQAVSVRGSRELEILTQSFNQMAQQLHQALEKLTQNNQELTSEVKQQMAHLQASEDKFAKAFRASPMPMSIAQLDGGTLLDVNHRFTKLFGYGKTEALGRTSLELGLWVDPVERDHLTHLLQTQGFFRAEEVRLQTKAGETRMAEVSAELIKLKDKPCILWVGQDITERKIAEAALEEERIRSEDLLLNILPQPIVERLKTDKRAIAEHFESVTILFADIVNFTALSTKMDPAQLVALLNQIFSRFDQLAEDLGLEKIKTIGDAYMVAAGLPTPRSDHALAIAEMALAMRQTLADFPADFSADCPTDHAPLQIRIGINTGVVVAGVIGIKKFIYDLWGDAVNVASRMESSGQAGQIQVTEATYEQLREYYVLEERGVILVKGKGKMKTYWLKGRRSPI
jgi:PAS domain S-box-containing protein